MDWAFSVRLAALAASIFAMPLLTPDVEPLWIARYDYEPGWQLPLHEHDDYFQLILIVGGTGEALIGRVRRPFHAGQMLFLRPGLAHGLIAGPTVPVRTLDTKFFLRRANLRAACCRLDPFHPRVDESVVMLLEAIHAEARRHGLITKELCQTLFAQLLLRLLQKVPPAAPADPTTPRLPATDDDDLAQRLERFLRENCAGVIDQRTLSAALHYSYRHLHNVWLKRHRESPLQALWHYRIDRAMQLIRYSDYELKRVAELTGFATVHHFTRVFTRIAGVSPARWRERERNGVRQDIVIRPGFVNRALTIQAAATPGV
jgi:AraC-like DNA-binding protein